MVNSRIDLRTIHEISEKPIQAKLKGAKSKNILVLHYFMKGEQELVLKFDSSEEKRMWWQGVQYFIIQGKTSDSESAKLQEIRNFWLWSDIKPMKF